MVAQETIAQAHSKGTLNMKTLSLSKWVREGIEMFC